jgi:hypothetical protein
MKNKLVWLFDLDTVLEQGPDSISQKDIYLDCFDMIVLKINKKYYFNIFLNKKLFLL